ncbi:MAG: tetratricopeptide repeat protein [Thermodesulfobacteriota bacterium]|nr:tetratricopeptide repeat protein [Thermodesulfobacteriota bacterium]
MDSEYLKNREAFLYRAYTILDKGAFEEAIKLAEGRINRYPGDVDAWLVIAASSVSMGRLRAAEKILRELNHILPGWPHICECLGDVLRKMGMTVEAMDYYKSARTLAPLMAERIAEKIAATEAGREDDETEADEISADFQTVTLADMYLRQGDEKKAISVLKKILERDPENREAQKRLKVSDFLHDDNKNTEVIGELDRWLQKLRMGRRKDG